MPSPATDHDARLALLDGADRSRRELCRKLAEEVTQAISQSKKVPIPRMRYRHGVMTVKQIFEERFGHADERAKTETSGTPMS
jgi:hypothetical protein